MDYKNFRVLHEYEIADKSEQHYASLVYLREFANTQGEGDVVSDDEVDQVMRENIQQGCNVLRELPARIISLEKEVEELNKMLRERHQLKGYFTLSAVSELKGGIPVNYSRITIHVTILVREETDVPYFVNIGYHKEVDNAYLMDLILSKHLLRPVYTLQEHPLVHSIICYKNATRQEFVYFLYRHNQTPHESILASVDTKGETIELLQGTDQSQCNTIQTFASSLYAQNNVSPLYQVTYITESAPCYIARLFLNRECELFTKAKKLLLEELDKEKANNPNCATMTSYLVKMEEA